MKTVFDFSLIWTEGDCRPIQLYKSKHFHIPECCSDENEELNFRDLNSGPSLAMWQSPQAMPCWIVKRGSWISGRIIISFRVKNSVLLRSARLAHIQKWHCVTHSFKKKYALSTYYIRGIVPGTENTDNLPSWIRRSTKPVYIPSIE